MHVEQRRTVFEGLLFDIEQMEVEIGRKGMHTFQIIRHPGGAAVLPLHDDGSVSLIRQLRPAAGESLIEIPAGRLGRGEDPRECARRELAEETGLRAAELIPLGRIYSSPGVFDEVIHLFAATGLSAGTARQEDDEDIELLRLPFQDALEMVAQGAISDAKTLAALLRWQLHAAVSHA